VIDPRAHASGGGRDSISAIRSRQVVLFLRLALPMVPGVSHYNLPWSLERRTA